MDHLWESYSQIVDDWKSVAAGKKLNKHKISKSHIQAVERLRKITARDKKAIKEALPKWRSKQKSFAKTKKRLQNSGQGYELCKFWWTQSLCPKNLWKRSISI